MSNVKAISEIELIKLLNNREVDAIGTLYDRYAAPLFGTIMKLVQDEEIACDILEKTFLDVWNKPPKEGSLRITLFAWMNNLSRDLALARLDQRIQRAQTKDCISHYKTPSGTVLTAVNFT